MVEICPRRRHLAIRYSKFAIFRCALPAALTHVLAVLA